MEKKKLKLTISGSSKKTINNIELAKSHGKNSVVIEKKNTRFGAKSSFTKNDILLSADFNLKKAKDDIIIENFVKAQTGRKNSQPLNKRSAGSLFKNPKNNSAGKLIDEAGLKGYSIGDAKISEKHANFFINDGKASSNDMLKLIKKAHDTVKEQFSIKLELEVKLMGFKENEIEGLC